MKTILLTLTTMLIASCGDMWNERRYDKGEFEQQREQVEDDNDMIQILPEEKGE